MGYGIENHEEDNDATTIVCIRHAVEAVSSEDGVMGIVNTTTFTGLYVLLFSWRNTGHIVLYRDSVHTTHEKGFSSCCPNDL